MSSKAHKGRKRFRSKFDVLLNASKPMGEGVNYWPK